MNKKIIVTLILIILTLSISTATFAIPTTIDDPDKYATEPSIDNSGEAMELVGRIVGLINVVGTIVLVATLMMLGIKYMTGSIEEKAEYKKTMIPILIGAFLLFSTTTIINVVYNLVPKG